MEGYPRKWMHAGIPYDKHVWSKEEAGSSR